MLLVAFGTRPEYLKLNPILKYWKLIGFNDWKVWLTGQHQELCDDLQENWEYKDHIWLYTKNHNLTNRLDAIPFGLFQHLELGNHYDPLFLLNSFKSLIVQGDTASSFACALAAFNRKIPVIHLEAGLRTYSDINEGVNFPYPEESYRRMISMITSIALCPTWQNAKNLENEKAPSKNFVVGNTVLDNIKDIKSGYSNKILCTLHRREKLEDIKEWFETLEQLAYIHKEYEFILPIHKNPAVYQYKSMFKRVKCIEPLEHNEFIDILKDCCAIVSDSGGLTEEGSWFGKPIFLCRNETERPEAWQFYTWCKTPNELKDNLQKFLNSNPEENLKHTCPFGDGLSSARITDILIKEGIIKISET